MDWGSKITYIGSTALKEKTVQFGIKDIDRTKHFSVLGRVGSGRGDMLVGMALQDIARGVGVVFLDATGTSATKLIERIDPSAMERVVFLDPADAEYPYSWNVLDDIKTLPENERLPTFIEVLSEVYKLSESDFLKEVAALLLAKEDTTLVSLFLIVTDEKFREKFFENDESGKKIFEEGLKNQPEFTKALEEEGKYIGKDTLIRNLLGQKDSKFTLDHLPDGQVVIVDLSHIRIYPSRMTPVVRTFVQAARIASRRSHAPSALYIHDALRYISEREIDCSFSTSENLAITVADTIIQEADVERRLFALTRCGSVASFATHSSDEKIIERAFYPHAKTDELTELPPGEFIVALSIDGLRAKPFFAKALSAPEKKHMSYQDLVVSARQRYSTSRTRVDATFKHKKDEDDEIDDPHQPRGFQDAFRSIFARQAKQAHGAANVNASKPEPEGNKEEKAPATPAPTARVPERREVPEDSLRQMLYVAPVAVLFLLLAPFSFAEAAVNGFSFTTEPQTVAPGVVSDQFTLEAQDASGDPANGNTICIEITSSSGSAEFSTNESTWALSPIRILLLTLASNQYRRNFYYRDQMPGSYTISVRAGLRPEGTTCTSWTGSQAQWTTSQNILVGSGSPSAQETYENGSGSESTSTTQSQPEASGGGFPVEPQIFVSAGPDRTVIVGADSVFGAETAGLKGAPLPNARVVWTFGDGGRKEGGSVLYNFAYPGTYVVVVDASSGAYSASDRLIATAIPAAIAITEVTGRYIALKNGNSTEVDIGGWFLFSAGKQFQFPMSTVLLPGKEVLVSNARTGLPGNIPSTVALQYPNGLVATSYQEPLFLTRAASPVTTPQASRENSLAAPEVSQEPEVPREAFLATPVAATAVGGSSILPWLLGLGALVLAAGGGAVFIRRGSYNRYSITEIQ